MSVAANLETLAAKQAITEVLYRYCRSMDRIDPDLGVSVWHPDGTAHYSGLFEGTGSEFISWVCDLHTGMVGTSHQISNIIIEMDGPDGAASESYVTVRLRVGDSSGMTDIVGTGRYLDQWSCRDGLWAIEHRQYVSDISTSLPVPQADMQERVTPADTVAPLPSQNGPGDASYNLFHFRQG